MSVESASRSHSLLLASGLTPPPRLRLALLPTRLQRLGRLSDELGIDLWVKRDDETGADLSGNKIRKLEYLLAQARSEDADVVITCGGVQSNHCRATALASRRLGMDSVVLLRGVEPSAITGNLFLDRLVGADVRYITPDQYAKRSALLPEAAESLRADGRRPYVIPEGGSNALGSWGYVQLVAELAAQGLGGDALESIEFSADVGGGATKGAANEVADGAVADGTAAKGTGADGAAANMEFPWDHIVCATGSGGTLAGLVLGRQLLASRVPGLERTRMWGVPVCDDGKYFQRKVLEIAEEFVGRWDAAIADGAPGGDVAVGADEIGILDGYKGPAYAIPYPEEIALIREVAREDGLFLDPVYTGKAFHGLVTEARNGRFRRGERVLFLHTGGIFSLFAFADDLLP